MNARRSDPTAARIRASWRPSLPLAPPARSFVQYRISTHRIPGPITGRSLSVRIRAGRVAWPREADARRIHTIARTAHTRARQDSLMTISHQLTRPRQSVFTRSRSSSPSRSRRRFLFSRAPTTATSRAREDASSVAFLEEVANLKLVVAPSSTPDPRTARRQRVIKASARKQHFANGRRAGPLAPPPPGRAGAARGRARARAGAGTIHHHLPRRAPCVEKPATRRRGAHGRAGGGRVAPRAAPAAAGGRPGARAGGPPALRHRARAAGPQAARVAAAAKAEEAEAPAPAAQSTSTVARRASPPRPRRAPRTTSTRASRPLSSAAARSASAWA